MSKLQLTKEDGERRGRYVARLDGIDAEGEITFRHRGEGIISADHAGVPDEMAGQGVAKALLDYMLEDARRSGLRIIPLCPSCAASMPSIPNGRISSPRNPAKIRKAEKRGPDGPRVRV